MKTLKEFLEKKNSDFDEQFDLSSKEDDFEKVFYDHIKSFLATAMTEVVEIAREEVISGFDQKYIFDHDDKSHQMACGIVRESLAAFTNNETMK